MDAIARLLSPRSVAVIGASADPAKWNEAAGNITGQDAFIGKTSGTSYGAQVEIWY